MKLDFENAKITINGSDEIDLSDYTSGYELTEYLDETYGEGEYEITDFENVPDDAIDSTEVYEVFFEIRDHSDVDAIAEIMDDNGIDASEAIDYFDEHYVGDSIDSEIEHYLGEVENVPEDLWRYIDYEAYWDSVLRFDHTVTDSGYVFRD